MTEVKSVDVLVIGGGINGCGVARDLAGRGFRTLLCEKGDLASATSSASTKLIHGGLRYLENYEFSLVKECLTERDILLSSAPHLIKPMAFVLPHHKKLRPWWKVKLGMFLYDNLGKSKTLPKSKTMDLFGGVFGSPLKNALTKGVIYPDCCVDDSRLVTLCALDAHEKGAEILTHVECMRLEPVKVKNGWLVKLRDRITGNVIEVFANMVINAAGPWVNNVIDNIDGGIVKRNIRCVKGSHIIVDKLYDGDHAYVLQNSDDRVIFTIPYEGKYTLIGTTDVEYSGDLDEVRINIDEVEYLCNAVNVFFRHQITSENIVWTYSGIRPLLDDQHEDVSKNTRDYALEIDLYEGVPILNIYGGIITTFRKLAEKVGDSVVKTLGHGGSAWTEEAFLPGGEGYIGISDNFRNEFMREYEWLPMDLAIRYLRAYGSRVKILLRGAKSLDDLGANLGDGIFAAEIIYLIKHEWSLSVEDILFRRSKLGLHISKQTRANVEDFFKSVVTK